MLIQRGGGGGGGVGVRTGPDPLKSIVFSVIKPLDPPPVNC